MASDTISAPESFAPVSAGTASLRDWLRLIADTRPDGVRLALVVQGGGLRSIYSMAALAVLEEEGLRDAFTHVVGSSAGALNGAYFLAGQAREAVSIYTEDMSDGGLVSPLRFWKVFDVDRLIDVTMKRERPLNVGAMAEARAALYTVLTDAETAQAHIVSSRDESVDLFEVLRATAALPGLYNRRVRVGSRRYVDGGVANLVPVDIAFREGATAALVILTRDAEYRRDARSRPLRAMLRFMPPGQSRAVRSRIWAADSFFEDDFATENDAPRTWTLRPSSRDRLITRVTDDSARLEDCAALGSADMRLLMRRACLDAPVPLSH